MALSISSIARSYTPRGRLYESLGSFYDRLLVDYDNHDDVGRPASIGYFRGGVALSSRDFGIGFSRLRGRRQWMKTISYVLMNDEDWNLAGVSESWVRIFWLDI